MMLQELPGLSPGKMLPVLRLTFCAVLLCVAWLLQEVDH
jgi:hypothetical protein